MRLPSLDLSPHAETLAAVVVGALLATASGVVANQLEAWFKRRERERTAALLFGEVISTLRVILEGAELTRRVGRPYGPVTRRMLLAARREIDIYERNRESLLDLRDAKLRVDLHNAMMRISLPLDGVIDATVTPDERDDEIRDGAFVFMTESLASLPPIVARLGRIAKHSFDDYDRIPRVGAPAPATTT
jgi:hypothetical protein